MAKKREGRAAKAGSKPGASPAMTAVMEYLKGHPKAPYREVVDAVSKNGHKIFPVIYGRAQALLGIVRMKRRGKRAARAPEGSGAHGPRGGARERGLSPGVRADAFAELQKFLAGYEALRRERDQLREALETAQRAIGKALR